MDNPTPLMLSVLISSIGAGYVVYGRKQRQGIALLAGIVMCVYPYFIDSPTLMIIIGVVLMIAPFLMQY